MLKVNKKVFSLALFTIFIFIASNSINMLEHLLSTRDTATGAVLSKDLALWCMLVFDNLSAQPASERASFPNVVSEIRRKGSQSS